MKILIDATYVALDTWYKSLTIYIFRFLSTIEMDQRWQFTLLLLPEVENKVKEEFPGFRIITYDPYSDKLKGNRLIKYFRRCMLYRKVVNASGCERIFVPNDLVMFSAAKTKLKKTVVIHDMKSINEKRRMSPSYMVFWVYYWMLMHYARNVVAISAYTKQDILRFFPLMNDKKIQVVYNSVTVGNEECRPSGIEKGYILCVSAMLPYKNLTTLVKAYVRNKNRMAHKLIVVGQKNEYWTACIEPMLQAYDIASRVVLLQDITDEELVWLYRHADLFVTPSLKEGFGYTPIEAAMCGCAVISTKCEALADTTQDLLFYYEPPTDEIALANKMMEVLQSPPSESHLRRIATTYSELYAPGKQFAELMRMIRQ